MAEATLKDRWGAGGEELAPFDVAKAGALSGVVGGLLMAGYAMGATTVLGQGPFLVPQLIGATLRGPDALLGGAGVMLWGAALHLGVSIAFGMLFAPLVRNETPQAIATIAGVAFALGLFVLMTFVVVPVVNPVMANRTSMMIGTLLVMHVAYGVGLGFAPPFRRLFARKPPRLQRTPTRITISTR